MRFFWLIALILLAGCTKTPEEAAQLFVIQASNGFTRGGGVVVASQHVLVHRSVLHDTDGGWILDGQGRRLRGKVLSEDPELNLTLVFVEELTEAADLGLSADLLKGDTLLTRTFDAQGKAQEKTGRLVGWKYDRGRAYMETDLPTLDDAHGAGVFDPFGRLIGTQAFKIGSDRTFLLPIEYAANGQRAMLSGVLGERSDDEAFTATRAAASKQAGPIVVEMKYDELAPRLSASPSALVGALTMLDSKSKPGRSVVKYRLEGVDAKDAQRVLSRGDISTKDRRWAPQPEAYATLTAKMTEAFGELWVQDILAPNDFGELRYRIPVTPLCTKVIEGEVHALTVTMGDGRTTGRQVLFNMDELCGGTATGEGAEWEVSWFSGKAGNPASTQADSATADSAPEMGMNDGKKARKKKKKKRRKGRKKKRR